MTLSKGLTYMAGGVLGLLLGWGLCGLLLWSIVSLATVIERRGNMSERSVP